MKILPLSEAKAKLSALVDEVSATDEEVVITKDGRAAAVLVSPDEYEGWKETIAIHGDAVLMRDIKAGLAALKARKAKVYTLEASKEQWMSGPLYRLRAPPQIVTIIRTLHPTESWFPSSGLGTG